MVKALPVQGSRAPIHLGARLRAARLAKRHTLDETASLSGLTKGFLSRVERDLTSPSVASLVALCQVLQIEIGSLFTTPSTTLVRLSDAPTVDLGGTGIDERLVTGPDEQRLQMLRAVIAPGGHGEPDLYAIDCDREVWHVTSGAVEVTLNNEVYQLTEGDTLTFSGREPHTWRNTHHTESVVLIAMTAGTP